MRVSGKVAIITGGAGGIGAEAARFLAREGAKVIVTDISEQAGMATAKELGGEFFQQDVSNEAQWHDIVSKVTSRHGKVDVLVNSAGIEGDFANSGLKTSLAEWRRVLSINLDGTFLGCRIVLQKMLEQGAGSIINIASIVYYFASPTALAYGASKAAVQQLTRSMAQLGGANGKRVRCNSVHPGIIRTRMTDNIITQLGRQSNLSAEAAEAAIVGDVLFAARGTPADVANLILFLAADESSYITGSAFQVDGGWHLVSAG